VDTENGEWWFLHFQSRGVYGRILHLQPAAWTVDNWIVIGEDIDGDGCGVPVLTYKKPNIQNQLNNNNYVLQASDEFTENKVGLQWQWQANKNTLWYSFERKGFIRLFAQNCPTEHGNIYYAGNLLLQKLCAPAFTAETCLETRFVAEGERAGLTVFGNTYTYIALIKGKNTNRIAVVSGENSRYAVVPKEIAVIENVSSEKVWLKVHIFSDETCSYSYSIDGKTFNVLGEKYPLAAGTWIGAKVGIFSVSPNIAHSAGYADFDYFRIQ
jgi:beta-xylosidase